MSVIFQTIFRKKKKHETVRLQKQQKRQGGTIFKLSRIISFNCLELSQLTNPGYWASFRWVFDKSRVFMSKFLRKLFIVFCLKLILFRALYQNLFSSLVMASSAFWLREQLYRRDDSNRKPSKPATGTRTQWKEKSIAYNGLLLSVSLHKIQKKNRS